MRALLLCMLCLALPAAAFDCPGDQRLSLDLAGWKKGLKAAAPGSSQQRDLLRAMGFAAVPSGSKDVPEAPCASRPALKALDDLDSKLTGEGDRTIQARFEMCSGAQRFTSQRIAVVVPLEAGVVCKLDGDDLSRDQAASDVACAGRSAPLALPRNLSLVKLTSNTRNVLRVDDQNGDCKGAVKSGSTRLALYEAHGATLDRIFENKTWERTPAEETVWKLAWGKTVPRTIAVTRRTRCAKGSVCESGEATQRYAYAPPPVSAYVRDGEMQ